MKIIEVDQWTSTGNIREMDFDTFALKDVRGGEDMRAICGLSIVTKTVNPNDSPIKGYVWFRKGADGKCERYKSNYDTSD